MNKRIWVVVTLATALGACSVSRQLAAPDKCQSESNITINHGAASVVVKPANFCAEPGQTITVKVVPPATSGTVHTRPSPGNPGPDHWMNGSNSQVPNQFTLEVPGDIYACPEDMTDDKCKYKYTIEIIDFVMLDPMITIRK